MEVKIEQDKKTHNAIVETYAEDMAKILQDDTQGLVKKIIHGEEEHQQEQKNLSPESKKNKFFMYVSILLVMLALVTLSFFFFKKDTNTVPVEKPFVPIINSDQSTSLEISALDKDQIKQNVLNEVETTKVAGLEGIYLTENKQVVGLRHFISLIKANFIPDSNPLLVSDNFLLGVVKNQANANQLDGTGFFILIKVNSTTDIFDSLRAWETTLLTDLSGFLGINTKSDTNYLFTKNFEDGIVENKNARILYDKDGKIILMYIFADDNSVVITDSSESAHEIILRLAAGATKQ